MSSIQQKHNKLFRLAILDGILALGSPLAKYLLQNFLNGLLSQAIYTLPLQQLQSQHHPSYYQNHFQKMIL